MFELKIEIANAAFADEPREELARMLRQIADQIENGASEGKHPARDVNGNTCGDWLMTLED